jgi:hypothetical protein
MKRTTLLCSALLLVFLAACEAEEEPAAPLPWITTTDAGEGDTVGSDTADTVTTDDAVVSDAASEEDLATLPDTPVDDAEDSDIHEEVVEEDVEEDVTASDVFTPDVVVGACMTGGNPGAAKFGDVDEQLALLVVCSTDCMKDGFMDGEPFNTCVRERTADTYGSTEECGQCFATRAGCLKNFCFAECMMGSSRTDQGSCEECEAENYCLHPFETCTGLIVF